MKKLIPFLLTGVLMFGATACSEGDKTSANAPDSTANNGKVPDANTVETNKNDAQSGVRKAQVESDIRAREERNKVAGDPLKRADGDLASEVRGKLEANIPASSLTIAAKDGTVTISGTVPTQEQLNKIEGLAKQIKGVTSVNVKATVAPATPK